MATLCRRLLYTPPKYRPLGERKREPHGPAGQVNFKVMKGRIHIVRATLVSLCLAVVAISGHAQGGDVAVQSEADALFEKGEYAKAFPMYSQLVSLSLTIVCSITSTVHVRCMAGKKIQGHRLSEVFRRRADNTEFGMVLPRACVPARLPVR